MVMKDVKYLIDKEKLTWEEQRDMILMPLAELKKIVDEKAKGLDDFVDKLDEETYGTNYDMNFDQEKVEHDHILHLCVDDVSKYKDDAAFEKVKDEMFQWIEGDYEKVIGEQNAKRNDTDDHCPHVAEKKSLFEFPNKNNEEMAAKYGAANEGDEGEGPQIEMGGEDEEAPDAGAESAESSEEISSQKDDL